MGHLEAPAAGADRLPRIERSAIEAKLTFVSGDTLWSVSSSRSFGYLRRWQLARGASEFVWGQRNYCARASGL
eukprot:30974-Pelagococcus_subviridis.AAC.1